MKWRTSCVLCLQDGAQIRNMFIITRARSLERIGGERGCEEEQTVRKIVLSKPRADYTLLHVGPRARIHDEVAL